MGLEFEQQARESNKAFAAFRLYLSLGPERSLEAVRVKCGKSARLIQRWSSRWRWSERVQAYGTRVAAIERQTADGLTRAKAAERTAREQAQREDEWKTRAEALELAREAIGRWKKNIKRCGSLEGIARLLDLASTLGRRSVGMALDRTEVTGEDGGAIRVEFEAALRKVYGDVVDVQAAPAAPALPEGRKG